MCCVIFPDIKISKTNLSLIKITANVLALKIFLLLRSKTTANFLFLLSEEYFPWDVMFS
jgi:hypothetical protein